MRNHEYWVKKDQMKVTARQHTDEMYTNYAAEITDRINRTMLYDNSNMATRISGGRMPVCEVVPLDVVSAILNEKDSPKMCVLNFASFKNPGGMFLEGSIAQEECLCHGSYLYNVLSSERLRPAYEYNRTCLNRSMYQNHAFYTPDVRFFKDNTSRLCDVITCAALIFRQLIDIVPLQKRKTAEFFAVVSVLFSMLWRHKMSAALYSVPMDVASLDRIRQK